MFRFIDNGSITSVNGIQAAGINSGIKKSKKDLALIYSNVSAEAAGTFTLNKVVAAPLVLSKNIIQQKKKVKAILINSGNANACTGAEGYENALKMQSHCADKVKIKSYEVIISSTGVIGQQLPMEKLLNGIGTIPGSLSTSGGEDAAEAIMTTDKKKKSYAVKVRLSKGEVTIGGICKGSGMIMPNMATMLAFIATDAFIEHDLLQHLIKEAVNDSFNKISVDGDTSTNDMVILLANGLSEIKINPNDQDYKTFRSALVAICQEMAKSIASDGEGATKLITILINKAKTKQDANWGRILSAAGNSGAYFIPEKVSIKFDDLSVLQPNFKFSFCEEEARKILAKDNVTISVDLDEGIESSTWWTCDFSEEYVKINANYRT